MGAYSVADPGESPHPTPPLFLDQTEAQRSKKNFLRPPPLLSLGLDDRSPPLSEGLDRPLLFEVAHLIEYNTR